MSYIKLPQTALAIGYFASSMLMMSGYALAADLDPGYADVPAPIPQQMVTFGSGWYIRGDIAATEQTSVGLERLPSGRFQMPTYSFNPYPSRDLSYDVSLGGGYAFTNSIRSDITIDFFQPREDVIQQDRCFGSNRYNCSSGSTLQQYTALLNGYYDFGTWNIVTPYVGAGVGVSAGSVQTQLYQDGSARYPNRLNYKSFAWALMAGVALDVYAHTKLDIGYRYINNGSALGRDIYNHEIRAGLRYMIDN